MAQQYSSQLYINQNIDTLTLRDLGDSFGLSVIDARVELRHDNLCNVRQRRTENQLDERACLSASIIYRKTTVDSLAAIYSDGQPSHSFL